MEEYVEIIKKAIEDKKGEDIIVYDFHTLNPFIDYTILTSASNLRQVYAIADHVLDSAHEAGIPIRSMEGDKDSRWILVDLYHVIVHVFLDEERDVYKLEKLYADLPILERIA